MNIKQFTWSTHRTWQPGLPTASDFPAHLVLIFGATDVLKKSDLYQQLRVVFPEAILFGCSTAGEIAGVNVTDDSLVATAVHFESTSLEIARTNINQVKDSLDAGIQLGQALSHKGLKHVLVLSDGLNVNGSHLVDGLRKSLPEDVSMTGGLSGDGARFGETYVIANAPPESNTIVVLGLYGEKIKIGYGSFGGWDPFGPERLITRSRNNVLYEVDGKSALQLYKTYLGEHAEGLPATGLLFPLCLRTKEGKSGVVRTVLSVDEKENSMTFAGDLPEGAYVRLMMANFDRLIDGAAGAAKITLSALEVETPELALLISCVGRKMVLKQRVEEEVEGVREKLGESVVLTGFYSYGEISPFSPGADCELHNQTMTITSMREE